jgi:uncharacterized protein YndB with AHSA1/START domain
MTQRSAQHATFVIERSYDASPAQVFAAFATPGAKTRWFATPEDWKAGRYELDFRVGGLERSVGGAPGGPVYTFEARYQDIVPNQRIVCAYDMLQDDKRISVSLVTIELTSAGAATLLTFTEQAVFLDGLDNPAVREEGTRSLLDTLDGALKQVPAA